MNKTVKKILSGIAAFVLSVSVFTGCAPATPTTVKTPSSTTTNVVESEPTET